MNSIRAQKGFTLVEALIALMILSIAATAILSVFAAGARQSSSRSARHDMHRIAQSELALLYAGALAGDGDFDREIERDGYRIRLSSRRIATTADSIDQSHLFEISATVGKANDKNAYAVTLSDYVRTRVAE